MQTLHTVERTFAERLFHIPDYQRGYAWERQQWQDFIEDLEFLPEDKQHYMGTLILHQRADDPVVDEEGHSYTTYDVVDGQQRLTTMVLYLDALRREMQALDAQMIKLAQGIWGTYIAIQTGERPIPKLTLNRDTHPFFYNTILMDKSIEGATIRSHQQLRGAKDYFRAYVAGKRAEKGAKYAGWLRAQQRKVATRLSLMVYTLETEADAGVVFETMNNRGKALTELEKVKNYVLYLASKMDPAPGRDLAAQINETWTHIFEQLMARGLSDLRNEDQLLRAHWLMGYNYRRGQWAGSRSIKEHFGLRAYEGRYGELRQDLYAYLESLRSATTAYCDVYKPKHPNAFQALRADETLRERVVFHAERFARLGAPATFLPLLMAMRIRSAQEPENYLKALDLAEKYVFRVYRWIGRRANTGQNRIFRLGHELFQGRTARSVLDDVRQAILDYCPDQRFQGRFEQEGSDWYHWWGLKYTLYEYESHLARQRGEEVRMPWEVLTAKSDTIEHILPQTPDAGGYWEARFAPEAYERYVHDIGNLTLTYDNSALSNKPFPDKKGTAGQAKTYAGSKLFTEQQIAQYDDWTPAQIEQRRNEIAAWAVARWQVDPRPAASSVEAIVQAADAQGAGASVRALIEAAETYRLALAPQADHLVFAPPTDEKWALLRVWPRPGGVEIDVRHRTFARFFAIDRPTLDAILGPEGRRTLTAEGVAGFIDQLDDVFAALIGVSDAADLDLGRVQGIQRLLQRSFIQWGQISLYHALYKNGYRWISITELAEWIRKEGTGSLGGVLGALGRKINGTEGLGEGKPGAAALFEMAYRRGERHYRMRPETRAAIESLPKLHEMIQRPLGQILKRYKESWWADPGAQRKELGLERV